MKAIICFFKGHWTSKVGLYIWENGRLTEKPGCLRCGKVF